MCSCRRCIDLREFTREQMPLQEMMSIRGDSSDEEEHSDNGSNSTTPDGVEVSATSSYSLVVENQSSDYIEMVNEERSAGAGALQDEISPVERTFGAETKI